MVKSPIKVLVRARPTVNFATKNIVINEQTGHVNLSVPKNETQGYVNHQQESWKFKFDKVMQNKPQETVFESSAKEILKGALEGYSGTVLCYGQTGAGKTFTMNGDPLKAEQKGIIPRTISALFKEIQNRPEQNIVMKMSYLEIYNENISDLLDPNPNANIIINEDPKKGISLKGVSYKVCANEKEALNYLVQGNTHRTVSDNSLNSNSSRSHAIFTIYLEIRSKAEYEEKVIYSKINLVDLAGSERTKKTKSEGKTLTEANFINKSLFFLEQMVVALSEKQREHVPYRHSKLTYLLKDSIGGNSKTLMIANILPEITNLEETISTLKFATRMMKVSNEVKINVKVDPQVLIKKYENEIHQLRRELATQSVFGNKSPFPCERPTVTTPDQKKSQYKIAKAYLKGEIEEIEIHTIPHAHAMFKQFRRAYKNMNKRMKKKFETRVLDTCGNETVEEITVVETQTQSQQPPQAPLKKKKNKKAQSSIDKNMTKDDIKNITTNCSTGDDSTEGLQTEADAHTESDKKSYYVSSIHRINDLEKTEIFSQSNNTFEADLAEELKSPKLSDNRHRVLAPSQYSVGSKEDLYNITQKAHEIKSLQYLQDPTPRSVGNDVVRTENDLRFPRRKFKREAEKIQELKSTIDLINQSISEAKSMLSKQFDAYQKKGYALPKQNETEDIPSIQHENILTQSFHGATESLAFEIAN